MRSLGWTLLWTATHALTLFAISDDPALVGYWGFDEGISSSELFDYSGRHATAKIHGEVRSVDGVVGKALQFNGPANFVDVLDGDWNIGAPMSLLFWFKPVPTADLSQANGTLIERQGSGAIAGMFLFRADGSVTLGDTHAHLVDCGLPRVRMSEWNFVACTVRSNEVRTYTDGHLVGKVPINGFPSVPGRLSIGARGSVGDSYFQGSIDEVAIYHRVFSDDDIARIYQNYKTGSTPIDSTRVEIIGLSTGKLLYAPKESGSAKIVLKNFGGNQQKLPLDVRLVSLLRTETAAYHREINFAPGEVRTVDLPLDFTGHTMGCEVLAQVGEGPNASRAREYFSVSGNLWEIGICGNFSPSQDCQKTPLQLERELEDVRRAYANWLEVFFWAPDDWGCLAPERDHWWSGQTSYLIRGPALKSLINQAHQHGIKLITYGKNIASGPEGWDLARRHPHWFLHDFTGRTMGVGLPSSLDNWNDEELRKSGKFSPGWQWLMPDLRNREALDWGIDQIIRSTRDFGWDGIRFDGHFTAGDDEWTTFNTRRMKEMLWRDNPGFLFGYNYGVSPDTTRKLNHEEREAMAGGGMWLQEAIGQWRYGAGLTYTKWSDYARNELRAAKRVQAAGGSYHGIYNLGDNPVQDTYKLIFALIAGGHPVYGGYNRTPGCPNWGQFMTRWSALLWDHRLQPSLLPENTFTISTPGSTSPPGRPIQSVVQELVESSHRKFVIVHLVNPPTTDSIQATTNLPTAIGPITIDFRNLPKPLRIGLVHPESTPYDQKLTPIQSNRGFSVTISNLNCWAMVVLEIRGNFAPSIPGGNFSEPPNPRMPIEVRHEQFNPLWENEFALKTNEQIFETDSSFQNVNAEVVSDPEASGGLAQRKDWRASVIMGRSWVGPFRPGRYQVNYRIKWVEDRPGTEAATLGVTEQTTQRLLARRDVTVFDPKVTSPSPGKYQYHPIDITLTNSGFIQCFLGTSQNLKSSSDMIFLDHLRIQCLESLKDDQINPNPPPLAPDLPHPDGAHPKKILLIKGLYWQQYGIEKALPCDTTYTLPTTPRELFSFDALILCNIDFTSTDLPLRALYREYARVGGRLIFLGGPSALNLGGLRQTFLEDILPVQFEDGDFGLKEKPLELRDMSGVPFPDHPYLFWSHRSKTRPDAETLASAGDLPILSRRKIGHGEVIVFTGTVLGESTAGQTAFWDCPSWTKLVRRAALE